MHGRKECDPINGCGKFYKEHLTECPYCDTPEAFSNFVPFNPLDWSYDLECYPNIFTASFKHMRTGVRLIFEISERRDDLVALYSFLMALQGAGCRMIGYNNVGYDYPLLHFIIEHYHLRPTYTDIYNKSASIIATPWKDRYNNVIWDNDTHIQQIDLMKIHHFDNENRRTSLKILEFNMRSENVEDLPFPPGEPLRLDQMPVLIKYNDHDVDETGDFYIESLEMIEFREQLSEKHGRNFLNHSDKKIGTDLFIDELEKAAPGSCYTYINRKRVARQTIRNGIVIKDIIFPYIKFKNPEFQRIKQWYESLVVYETKGSHANSAIINGFSYDCKLGGIHGSISSTIVYSDEIYVIKDIDVGGYYPEVGTANNLYPEHLSDQFCVVNNKLKQERKLYKKGTALNNSIKLARNGAYGDSNSKYSPFYDPQYTMSITINGQLLLCMLAQYLIEVPGLEMIQVNTDGLTVKCPRAHVAMMDEICKWWEQYTCLELESATYSRMFIRDVNNYIAEYEDGKLKSKGAYVHKTKESQGSIWRPNDMDWNQDFSALIIPKAAEAALIHGTDIREFIINHNDRTSLYFLVKVKNKYK